MMKRPSSRALGTIYLAIIPAYALVYDGLPYHFYHSTVVYEQSVRDDAERLKRQIHFSKPRYNPDHEISSRHQL